MSAFAPIASPSNCPWGHKALGNYIGVTEPPKEIFGKVMSIPDNLISSYYELLTDVSPEFLNELKEKLSSDKYNPMDSKKELGVLLTSIYHDEEKAKQAREEFERVYADKGIPDEMLEFRIDDLGDEIWIVKLLTDTNMLKSRGEARRLIKGGGLYLDNERIEDDTINIKLENGMLFKVGKRRFFRIVK